MDTTAILGKLETLGLSVTLEGDDLVLVPGSKVPAEMIPVLKEHKVELIEHLGQDEPPRRYKRLFPGETARDAELAEIERQVLEHVVCLTWSSVLEDYIVFYLSEAGRAKVPSGFTPYSDAELRMLFSPDQKDLTVDGMRKIHIAKRAGMDITGVKEVDQ